MCACLSSNDACVTFVTFTSQLAKNRTAVVEVTYDEVISSSAVIVTFTTILLPVGLRLAEHLLKHFSCIRHITGKGEHCLGRNWYRQGTAVFSGVGFVIGLLRASDMIPCSLQQFLLGHKYGLHAVISVHHTA